MSIKSWLLVCTLAGAGLAAVSPTHAEAFLPVPPASFLDYHISTTHGLSEEVAADRIVRARLARHFGLREPALVEYVRRNLVETTLTARQAGRYRVACIGPTGREYWVSERLAAGTPVFALAATGKPILRLACGNPLTTVLPRVSHPPLQKERPAVLALSPKTLPKLAQPTGAVSDQTFALQTPFTPPEIAPVSPITEVDAITQSLGHGGGSGFALLPAAGSLVGLGGLSALHRSTPAAHIMPAMPVSPSVPEPSTLALFGGFGLVMLAMQANRRKR